MIFDEFIEYRMVELNIISNRFDICDLFKDKRFFIINYKSIDKQAYDVRGLSYFYNIIKSVKDKIIIFHYPLPRKDRLLLVKFLTEILSDLNIVFINESYTKMTSYGFNSSTSELLYSCDLSLSITINDNIKIIKNKDRLDMYLPSSIQRDEKYIDGVYLKTRRAIKLYQILEMDFFY